MSLINVSKEVQVLQKKKEEAAARILLLEAELKKMEELQANFDNQAEEIKESSEEDFSKREQELIEAVNNTFAGDAEKFHCVIPPGRSVIEFYHTASSKKVGVFERESNGRFIPLGLQILNLNRLADIVFSSKKGELYAHMERIFA